MTHSIASQQTPWRLAACPTAAAVMSTNESALTEPTQRLATTATLATHGPTAKRADSQTRACHQTLDAVLPTTDGNPQGIVTWASPLASVKPQNLKENNEA